MRRVYGDNLKMINYTLTLRRIKQIAGATWSINIVGFLWFLFKGDPTLTSYHEPNSDILNHKKPANNNIGTVSIKSADHGAKKVNFPLTRIPIEKAASLLSTEITLDTPISILNPIIISGLSISEAEQIDLEKSLLTAYDDLGRALSRAANRLDDGRIIFKDSNSDIKNTFLKLSDSVIKGLGIDRGNFLTEIIKKSAPFSLRDGSKISIEKSQNGGYIVKNYDAVNGDCLSIFNYSQENIPFQMIYSQLTNN